MQSNSIFLAAGGAESNIFFVLENRRQNDTTAVQQRSPGRGSTVVIAEKAFRGRGRLMFDGWGGGALPFDDAIVVHFALFRVVCSRRRFVARGDTRSRPRMQDGRGGGGEGLRKRNGGTVLSTDGGR